MLQNKYVQASNKMASQMNVATEDDSNCAKSDLLFIYSYSFNVSKKSELFLLNTSICCIIRVMCHTNFFLSHGLKNACITMVGLCM